MKFDTLSYLVGDPSYQGHGPTAWEAPESFVTEGASFSEYDYPQDDCEIATHTGNPSPSFNPWAAGIGHYLGDVWTAMREAIKQQESIPKATPVGPDFEYASKPPGGGQFADPPSKLPPSFTYDGPVAGAGFLGLFPPAPGSPKYNDYVNKTNFKVDTEGPSEDIPPGTKPVSPLNQLNKWGGNVGNSWNEFTKGVSEGYNEEKGHEWYDLLPGFSETSNMPLMLMAAGGILLLILIIK